MVGAILEATAWIGLGCLTAYLLWFGIGTIWIAFFYQNEDGRTAKRLRSPFDLKKFMGM